MFGKLLKYDFTHYLKLWVIGAAIALVMSVVGGFCLSQVGWLYKTDRTFIALVFTLAIIVSVVCIIAFSILNTILICMRYAKNCYSDEGYLTFTLPAKRSAIFNAKFVNGLLYNFMTSLIVVLAFAVFLGIGVDNFIHDFIFTVNKLVHAAIEEIGVYFWIYFALIVVIMILCALFSVSMVYFCITFAGTKVRKNKVLAGVGIYYLFGVALSVVSQLGGYAASIVIGSRADKMDHPAMLVLLAILAVWIFGCVAALYYSQLHMLDKKLNLA